MIPRTARYITQLHHSFNHSSICSFIFFLYQILFTNGTLYLRKEWVGNFSYLFLEYLKIKSLLPGELTGCFGNNFNNKNKTDSMKPNTIIITLHISLHLILIKILECKFYCWVNCYSEIKSLAIFGSVWFSSSFSFPHRSYSLFFVGPVVISFVITPLSPFPDHLCVHLLKYLVRRWDTISLDSLST